MKFKLWISLQDILDDIHKAVDTDQLSSKIYEFVSTALFISEEDLDSKHWAETAVLFLDVNNATKVEIPIPMFKSSSGKKQPLEWDYKGRNYYAWVHPLCKEYGWTLEYVDELDHNIALALIQEIELDKQFNREWEWSLSEMAYPYDTSSKKSKFVPLDRPSWMRKTYEAPKISRMKKSLMPSGSVVRLDEPKEST